MNLLSSNFLLLFSYLFPDLIEHELEGFGIRLNKKKPAIAFKRKDKGGINFTHTVPLTHVDKEYVEYTQIDSHFY